ncbi:MAG: hypothetical protein WKG07_44770 [Hymenobacter sp.]
MSVPSSSTVTPGSSSWVARSRTRPVMVPVFWAWAARPAPARCSASNRSSTE